MKDRKIAGILAILLGGFGVHKFYLGNILMGVVYLVFSFTLIPAIVGLIEGIMMLTMKPDAFDEKYNSEEVFKSQMKRSNERYDQQHAKLLDTYESAVSAKDIAGIMDAGSKFSKFADSQELDRLYKYALSLIRENPQVKTYALEMGRAKYSYLRKGGSPTIYDESAIQNDIIAAQ